MSPHYPTTWPRFIHMVMVSVLAREASRKVPVMIFNPLFVSHYLFSHGWTCHTGKIRWGAKWALPLGGRSCRSHCKERDTRSLKSGGDTSFLPQTVKDTVLLEFSIRSVSALYKEPSQSFISSSRKFWKEN